MSAELKINCEDFYLNVEGDLNISCIYRIIDWKSGRIYVGKAANLLRRYNDHKSALRNNRHCNQILQRTYNKDRKLIMEVIQKLDIYDETSDDIELEFIKKYDSCNHKVGMNIINEKLPKRPTRKIDVYDKEYNFVTTYNSIKETSEKLKVNRSSIPMICMGKGGYKFSKNGYHFRYHGENIIKPVKREYIFVPKPSIRKVIIQLDLEGNYIKEWCSITEASKILGLQESSICSCAKGNHKTSGGFKFKYK